MPSKEQKKIEIDRGYVWACKTSWSADRSEYWMGDWKSLVTSCQDAA